MAPALNRGLALLAVLDQGSPQPLETLAARLDLPRPSVFRLLSALAEMGMVRKRPDKCYESLWNLRPARNPALLFCEKLFAEMPALVQETGCTVEWYESCPEGMRIIRQDNPEREVRVVVRQGYIRNWLHEFDSVACLGYAFATEAPAAPAPTLRRFVSDGVMSPLPVSEAVECIESARKRRRVLNEVYNHNAVRRQAVACFVEHQFLGVLAVAEAFRFQSGPAAVDTLHKIVNFVKRLA